MPAIPHLWQVDLCSINEMGRSLQTLWKMWGSEGDLFTEFLPNFHATIWQSNLFVQGSVDSVFLSTPIFVWHCTSKSSSSLFFCIRRTLEHLLGFATWTSYAFFVWCLLYRFNIPTSPPFGWEETQTRKKHHHIMPSHRDFSSPQG